MTDNSETVTEATPKASTAKKSKTRAPSKADAAFRTISEVSEELDVPQHVLRFWETKFTQVKPTKRAGGRRYYRPQDVELLRQIQRLLHDDAFTIKGVQKVLKSARGVSSAIEKAKEAGVDLAAETVHVGAETADDAEQAIQQKIGHKAPYPAPGGDAPKLAGPEVAPLPAAVKTAAVVSLPRTGQSSLAEKVALDTDQAPDRAAVPASSKPSPELVVMRSALEKALHEFKTLRRDIDELLQQLPSTS